MLRRAVRSRAFAEILGGRHMECAYYFRWTAHGMCLLLYSFPGSAWERIGVEAPASRVYKLRMHFGEAEPRLH